MAISTALLAIVIGFSHAQEPGRDVWIGIPRHDQAQLQTELGAAGTVRERNPDGFWRVTVPASISKRDLERRVGVGRVHPGTANWVDSSRLASVLNHLNYAQHRAQLMGGDSADQKQEVGEAYEALIYFLKSRVGPDGRLDFNAIKRSIDQRERLPRAVMAGAGGNSPDSNFAYVGPKNLDVPQVAFFGQRSLSGRINGIGIAPSNPSTVFVATNGGGLWKSTDEGANWSYKSGGWPTLQTNCVAVHPTNPNIVLVGTGTQQGSMAGFGFGIMRSTDGGDTWEAPIDLESSPSMVVSRIMFDPDDPDVVLTLTSSIYSSGEDGDIYRSTNRGQTWSATNAPTANWHDIDYNISSGGARAFWAVGKGASAYVIYRSTNHGATWNATASNPTASGSLFLDVACSRVTANKTWVLSSSEHTIFRTTNGGSSWTDLNPREATGFPTTNGSDPQYNWSQDWYDVHLTCGRTDGADVLYCGLITLAASRDGGNNWADIGETYQVDANTHNDQHCMAPMPGDSPFSYVGNDGGIHLLFYQNGFASFGPLNDDLYTTQFYHMSVHPTNSAYVMGGTQDNASPASRGSLSNWRNLQGGDGSWSAFDQNSPAIHYTSGQRGSVHRYTSSTDYANELIAPHNVNGVTWSAEFMAPLAMCSGGSQLIAGADNRIYRYTGVGDVWTPGMATGSPVRTIAVGLNNTNRVYTGGESGTIFMSGDGGLTGVSIGSGLPDSDIGAIACNWTNSGDVLVGLHGSTGGLYRCTNATAANPAWTSVRGTAGSELPYSPVNTVVRDPDDPSVWYVGTDIGAFMTTNNGYSWANMNSLGIGNVRVNHMVIPPTKDYLYVATFGRGIWRLRLASKAFTNFTLSASTIYGSESVTGTMTLNHPASIGTTATMFDLNTHTTMPTSATFGAGNTTKSFTITTTQVFGANSVSTVSATCLGTLRTATLTMRAFPTVSSLILSRSEVYGGFSVTATATLSAASPTSSTMSFTDTSTAVTSPGGVSLNAGTISKVVTLTTTNPLVSTPGTCQATYKGTSQTASLTVHPMPIISSWTINPNPAYAGLTGTVATVTLHAPLPIGTQFTISESAPFVTTGSPVTATAGLTTFGIPITSTILPAQTTVPISIRVSGQSSAQQTTNLVLRPIGVQTLTLGAQTLQGGQSTTETVLITNAAPVGGSSVLVTSNSSKVVPQDTVIVPVGGLTQSGSVTTLPVSVITNAQLTASYNGTTATANLTLVP